MELNRSREKHRTKTFISTDVEQLDTIVNNWFDTLSRDITIVDIKYSFEFRPDSSIGSYRCSALIHYTTVAET